MWVALLRSRGVFQFFGVSQETRVVLQTEDTENEDGDSLDDRDEWETTPGQVADPDYTPGLHGPGKLLRMGK